MDSVELAKKHIEEFGDLGYLFGDCCKLYSMTTENISGFLKKYDLKDKKVLTVAGSGDQRLNSYLMGAKEVTCFDVNSLCKLQLDLKDKAITHLEYDEFLRLFGITDDDLDIILDPEMFHKIEDYLEKDSWSFFHYLLFEANARLQTNIYYPFDCSLSKQRKNNAYLTPDAYYTLKRTLPGKSKRFINTGIDQLAGSISDEKFDVILLSNISDYTQLICPSNPLENYRRIIDQLALLLNEPGIMQVGYIYSRYSVLDHFSDFRINSCRTKYFPIGEYQIDFFDSYYGDGTYDKSIVYQKVKK